MGPVKAWNKLGLQWGFPGGSDGKESTCNAGDMGSIPGLGRSPGEGNGMGRSPGEGNGNLLWYSYLGNPLAGFSPWGHKEPNITEQPTLSLSLEEPPRSSQLNLSSFPFLVLLLYSFTSTSPSKPIFTSRLIPKLKYVSGDRE